MLRLSAVSATPAIAGAYLDAISDLEVIDVGGALYLCAVSGGIPGLTAFALTSGAAPSLTSESGLAATRTGEIDLDVVDTPLGPQIVLCGDPYLAPFPFTLDATGTLAAAAGWSDPGSALADAATLAASGTAVGEVLYMAHSGRPGFCALALGDGGATGAARRAARLCDFDGACNRT